MTGTRLKSKSYFDADYGKIVDPALPLIQDISNLLKEEQPSTVILHMDSNRQAPHIDELNARQREGTGSAFLGIECLHKYCTETFGEITFFLEKFLFTDVFNEPENPKTFDYGVHKAKNHINPSHIIPQDLKSPDKLFVPDSSKVPLIYLRIHRLASAYPDHPHVPYYFYDDHNDLILKKIHGFFSLKSDFIPTNMTLHLRHYDNQAQKVLPLTPIKGTGPIDYLYIESAKSFQEINKVRGGPIGREMDCSTNDFRAPPFRVQRNKRLAGYTPPTPAEKPISWVKFPVIPASPPREEKPVSLPKSTVITLVAQPQLESNKYPTKFWVSLGFTILFALTFAAATVSGGLSAGSTPVFEIAQTMFEAIAEYLDPLILMFTIAGVALVSALLSGASAYSSSNLLEDVPPTPNTKPTANQQPGVTPATHTLLFPNHPNSFNHTQTTTLLKQQLASPNTTHS